MSLPRPITIPDGFTLHTENTSSILLPSTNEAFLNPVQEFNRDLSVACIRVWSEELNKTKEIKWRQMQERKAKKSKDGSDRKRQKCMSFTRGFLWCTKLIPLIVDAVSEPVGQPEEVAVASTKQDIPESGTDITRIDQKEVISFGFWVSAVHSTSSVL